MNGAVTRGTAVLGIQQAVAFLCTMLLHVATGRYFGPEIYGLFSVVNAVLTLLVFTFLTGIPHAVSRFAAETPERAGDVMQAGAILQVAIGVLVGAGLRIGAGPLARLLDNPSLTPLFTFAAFALPLLGIALVPIHTLNGLHWFGRQAVALGSLNVFRVIGVLAFLSMGAGPIGAVRGIVLAAAATAVTAGILSRGIPGGSTWPFRRVAGYGAQLCVTYLALALWEQIDLLILESVGTVAEDPGLYAAAAALTSAPETVFFPLILALFPAVSRSTAAGATEDVAWYVSKSLGYAFRLLCPLAVGAFYLGNDLLGLFFGTEYLPAAFAIGPLVVAILFYTLYQLMDTYLRASGRGGLSLRIAGALLVGHVALDLLLVPRFQLAGTVVAIVISSILAAVAVAVPVTRTLRIRPRPLSIAKILAAAVLAFLPLAFWDPGDGKESVIASIPLLGVYVGLLALFREIDREDMQRVRGLLAMLRRGA